MQHNGEIVAIAYVLDIHAREKGQDGKNYIFNFLQFLRIRRYYKNKLTFCILSRFDRHFDLKKTNAKLIGQM